MQLHKKITSATDKRFITELVLYHLDEGFETLRDVKSG